MIKTIFCTLFNYFYIDKALVLYDSLKDVCDEFRIYILCMDERCYEILKDLNFKEMILIRLRDFEDEKLIEAKGNRSFGEYCFTCSSFLILFVLERYNEQICTYIDADMLFYHNPSILIEEMFNANKTVMITPHRFTPETKKLEKNGIYCVEFNTFVNEENSISILKKWREESLGCASIKDGVHFGDQKYLDNWPKMYPDHVHVCQHWGAGIAPWNIGWYEEHDIINKIVRVKKEGIDVPVIFYHFQHVIYESRNKIKTGILCKQKAIDYDLVNNLYNDYLQKIEIKKRMLEKQYNINYLMKVHHEELEGKGLLKKIKDSKLVLCLKKCMFPSRCIYTINL